MGRSLKKKDSFVYLDMRELQIASLDKEKTFEMWLGLWRWCSDEPGDLKWINDFQKITA